MPLCLWIFFPPRQTHSAVFKNCLHHSSLKKWWLFASDLLFSILLDSWLSCSWITKTDWWWILGCSWLFPPGKCSAKMWFPFSEAKVACVCCIFKGKLSSKFGTSHTYTVILKILAWFSNMDVLIVSRVSSLVELKHCRGKCYLICDICALHCSLYSLSEVIGERI